MLGTQKKERVNRGWRKEYDRRRDTCGAKKSNPVVVSVKVWW
jgi:hypothetical protein